MRQRASPMVAALIVSGSYLSACAPLESRARTAATPTAAQALCALGYSSIPLRTLPTSHHLVGVTVNGRPANFFVDTGAGRTVIHRAYADAFGLQDSGGEVVTAVGSGGASEANLVRVDEFTIAGTRTALNGIFVVDLSHIVKALDPIAGSPVHGIIGHDVMRTQHAIIDVQQERLYLKPLQGEQQTGC